MEFFLGVLTNRNVTVRVLKIFVQSLKEPFPPEFPAVEKMIRVKLKDGSICCMAKRAFYIFLQKKQVVEFERSDGWVSVDEIPKRRPVASDYNGPERRCA